MTLVIGLKCSNGIVIGADRMGVKFRATAIKSYWSKVFTSNFGDGRAIIYGLAGAKQDALRALREIDPGRFSLREKASLEEYLENIVEPREARLYLRLRETRGREPEYSLTIGCINPDGSPTLATVYNDGSFDLESISTMGVGAPFAELILRDIDVERLDIDTAANLIGVIIAKVSLVHAEVNGITYGMDILKVYGETPNDVIRLSNEELSKILNLAQRVSFSDIPDKLRKAIEEGSK